MSIRHCWEARVEILLLYSFLFLFFLQAKIFQDRWASCCFLHYNYYKQIFVLSQTFSNNNVKEQAPKSIRLFFTCNHNPVHKLMEKRQIYRKVAFLMYTEMVNFTPQS